LQVSVENNQILLEHQTQRLVLLSPTEVLALMAALEKAYEFVTNPQFDPIQITGRAVE